MSRNYDIYKKIGTCGFWFDRHGLFVYLLLWCVYCEYICPWIFGFVKMPNNCTIASTCGVGTKQLWLFFRFNYYQCRCDHGVGIVYLLLEPWTHKPPERLPDVRKRQLWIISVIFFSGRTGSFSLFFSGHFTMFSFSALSIWSSQCSIRPQWPVSVHPSPADFC